MHMQKGLGVALAATLTAVLCEAAFAGTVVEAGVVDPARPAVVRLYERPAWEEAWPWRPPGWSAWPHAEDRYASRRWPPRYGYAWRPGRPDARRWSGERAWADGYDRFDRYDWLDRNHRFDRYGYAPRRSAHDPRWRQAPWSARRDWHREPPGAWADWHFDRPRSYGWRD